MTIPQNDGFTVVLNRVTGQATYSADADTFSSEIDIFSNQVNDQATEMNATAIEVNQASNAAVGAANYKGEWSLATGAAIQGESFLHENQVWTLNVNVADITLSEPSSVNTDWRAIDSSLYQYAVSQLANGDFSKVAVIYAGLVIDSYDYVVYQEDGRIYERGSVTGTFSTPLDFDPLTGIDSGLSGALKNIKAIVRSDVFGLDQDWETAELTDTGALFNDGTAKYRVTGGTYTNTHNKPLFISIYALASAGSATIRVDGVDRFTLASNITGTLTAIIPPLATYRLLGTVSLINWNEYRPNGN